MKATPVKKPNPESEEGDLEPPKKDEEEKVEDLADLHVKEDPPAAAAKKEDAAPAEEKEDKAAGPVEKVHHLNPTDW